MVYWIEPLTLDQRAAGSNTDRESIPCSAFNKDAGQLKPELEYFASAQGHFMTM